jgi:hypothetical protein
MSCTTLLKQEYAKKPNGVRRVRCHGTPKTLHHHTSYSFEILTEILSDDSDAFSILFTSSVNPLAAWQEYKKPL